MNIAKSLSHGAVTAGLAVGGAVAASMLGMSWRNGAMLGALAGVAFYIAREVYQHQANDNDEPTPQTLWDAAIPAGVGAVTLLVALAWPS